MVLVDDDYRYFGVFKMFLGVGGHAENPVL